VGYNAVADNMGLSSFVYLLLHPKSARFRQILRKLELTAVQGHPRSSILVPIDTSFATSYTLVNNSNFGRISYCFRDIDV